MRIDLLLLLGAFVAVAIAASAEDSDDRSKAEEHRHHHRHHHHRPHHRHSEEDRPVSEEEEEGGARRQAVYRRLHSRRQTAERRMVIEVSRRAREERRLVAANRAVGPISEREMAARASNIKESSRINEQDMLDWHNGARWAIAAGKVPKQPTAANMIAVEWDDRVEAKARTHADECPTIKHMHDTNAERIFDPYFVVGQNVATTPNDYLDKVNMNAWAEEVDDYDYELNSYYPGKEAVVGHYQQVSWAYSSKLGCRFSDQCRTFDGNGDIIKPNPMVCNYAFGANWGQQYPKIEHKTTHNYLEGPPCSKCPEGYGWCLAGALCATKRMKDSSTTASHCSLTAADCQGTFDADECYCNCPEGFYGSNCEVKCEDNFKQNHKGTSYTAEEYCTSPFNKEQCSYGAQNYSSMYLVLNQDCRKTCGRCSTWIGIKDFNSEDRRKLQTRVHQGRFFWRGYAEDPTKTAMYMCEDRDHQCGEWAKKHACQSSRPEVHKQMQELCPNICEYCQPKGGKKQMTLKDYGLLSYTEEEAQQKASAPKCVDNYGSSCEGYAKADMCNLYAEQMKGACDKTCGFC